MSMFYEFKQEIEEIQDDKIREFVVDALAKVPDFYANVGNFISDTRRTVGFASDFLNVLDANDYTFDIVISAALLQDITRYYQQYDEDGELSIKEDIMHPLTVRQNLIQLMPSVGTETFDNIMRIVESSHGYNSPIPQVMPDMNDAVYLWVLPFANKLVNKA